MLLRIYKEWDQAILKDHVKNNQDQRYSNIFCLGIPSSINESKKKIMIIGQESKDFGDYGTWAIDEIFRWTGEYVDRQVHDVDNGLEYNRSPFWNLFRRLNESNYDLVWNNVDKVHKIVNGKTQVLSINDEKELNRKFGDQNNTLLHYEISLIKPDAIIFVTGPNYSFTMASSLGIDEKILKENRPNLKNETVKLDILDIPVYWTYHPAYLTRRRIFETSITKLQRELNSL
ncbi:MAG: hypothetical protein JXR48_03585 [Candidatus Delongbacteria bacterium]|nr:hypothetical protein [Candidatus Delongbacteria bacterium]